jgi:nicotinamidase-related amidase
MSEPEARVRSLFLEATPHGFEIDPGKTALLVIDMQRDFLDAEGWAGACGLDLGPVNAIVPSIARLIGAARKAGLCVIYTRENYRSDLADCPPLKLARGQPRVGAEGPLGRYLIQGQPCNDIIEALAPTLADLIVDKPGAGAFYATLLDQILRIRSISHLIVVGVTADVCVKTTLHEANDRGYECLLVEDAIASYNADFTAAVIAMARVGVTGSTALSTELELKLQTLARFGAK